MTCEKQRMGEFGSRKSRERASDGTCVPAKSEGGRRGVRGLKRDSEIVSVENRELTWETEPYEATLRAISPRDRGFTVCLFIRSSTLKAGL